MIYAGILIGILIAIWIGVYKIVWHESKEQQKM